MTPSFVVVSDFDGTITTQDMLVSLVTWVDPRNIAVVERANRRELDLKTALNHMFSRLPSLNRPQYHQYLSEQVRFRPGYYRWRTALNRGDIPFYIVSNGLDFILDAVLGDVPWPGEFRISNGARFTEPEMRIDWRYPCKNPCPGGCGLCKHRVMREIADRYDCPLVFIGDGVTDVNGAKMADKVYAWDRLASILQQDGVPFVPFDTFDDILSDRFFLEEGALA